MRIKWGVITYKFDFNVCVNRLEGGFLKQFFSSSFTREFQGEQLFIAMGFIF